MTHTLSELIELRAKATPLLWLAAGAAVALAWGQVQYNVGFEDGGDTTSCVIEYLQTEKPPRTIEACQRVNPNKLQLVLRRAYLRAIGDAVEFDQ